jgi:predicted CopG family antitoxin
MNTICIEVSDKVYKTIKKFSKSNKTSIDVFVRTLVEDWMNDLIDIQIAEKSFKNYEKNKVSYTLEEVEKMMK